jgi:hypothetical protein
MFRQPRSSEARRALPSPCQSKDHERAAATLRFGCGCNTINLVSATILSMPTEQILALLIAERDKLNRAIEALQGPTKRRGRPPKNPLPVTVPNKAEPAQATKKPRRRFAAAQRKQQAERMKAYWAAKKKTASATPTPKASKKLRKGGKAA